ncbi:MAG: hypothetical protein NXY57DRAFT_1008790 [Lentinula lateritia]|nr:MAG: hypothetical protein NXY57DRAFT_1008790 [Lentinula lateritia]
MYFLTAALFHLIFTISVLPGLATWVEVERVDDVLVDRMSISSRRSASVFVYTVVETSIVPNQASRGVHTVRQKYMR